MAGQGGHAEEIGRIGIAERLAVNEFDGGTEAVPGDGQRRARHQRIDLGELLFRRQAQRQALAADGGDGVRHPPQRTDESALGGQ